MTEAVAIAGPGLMGLGIAQVAARAGLAVRLFGRDLASAQAGHQRLQQSLARQVARGRLAAAEADAMLARVQPLAADAALADCALAIESVPEDRAVKAAVLAQLERALPSGAPIASNTSGLPIDGLADALRDPSRLLGLHFFSPVERMPLVEVVRGRRTSAVALAAALDLVRRVGQQPVQVADGPGFFTSRVFAAYLDEAVAMVGEGVDAARIDAVGKSLGRALGPLAVMDEVSLALNLQQARQAEGDGLPPEHCRLAARPVLEAMVAAGRSGRRQGGGFFDDDGQGGRRPWPGLAALFPPAAATLDDEAIAQRLRWSEALEALRCLGEGVIANAADGDTASRLGLGFPGGGVLHWANATGIVEVVRVARQLAARCGDRFSPPAWLVEQAALEPGDKR
ncbi:MAG: 3-hydroxyacyl-CoA dehydrogenase NAD-binding domain-containing protein [Rubrivivax sp.]